MKKRSEKKTALIEKAAALVKTCLAILIVILIAFILYKQGLFSCGGDGGSYGAYTPPPFKEGELTVYCLDVGQGDSFLLVSPGGKTMLIDSGEAAYARKTEMILHELGIETLDAAIGTHPHSDHIGAMSELIGEFGTRHYYMPDAPFETKLQADVDAALVSCGATPQTVWCGDEIAWDESCRITVLSPVPGCEYSSSDPNDWSVILRVEYGETSMLFTADATVHDEQLAMFHNERELIEADILKVAHHGSASSSSLGFIETVGAEYALISCGANNRYGHPDFDTVNRLSKTVGEILRTDTMGCITLVLDGENISVQCESEP